MKSSGAVQKQAERASRDAEPVLEQPKQVERGQAQGDNTEDRVLEQPEQDVRGVAARKHMRGSRRAKDAAAHAVGREEEDGRDGQGSFKEAKMGRDITRPVVIRAVARDTLSGRPAQAVGCEGGGRVPGGYPVTKTMDTEDGRDCRAFGRRQNTGSGKKNWRREDGRRDGPGGCVHGRRRSMKEYLMPGSHGGSDERFN
jgi:hypothetical protein